MKKFITKILKSGVVGTVVIIALGLLLTFFSETVANTIFYVMGAFCLLAACFYLYKCIKKEATVVNAFSALAYLALGLILVIFQSAIFSALPLTAGICLLVFGLLKLYTAFTFRKTNSTLFKKLLIPAAINAVLGIVLILIRDIADNIIIQVIGVILLYCACEGIISKLVIKADSKFASSEEAASSNMQIQAEYSDSDSENENQ